MKLVVAITCLVGGNLALAIAGAAPLIKSDVTNDNWKRVCYYYYPVRIFAVSVPLSQSCPSWADRI
jgi:hypothetical protein